MTRRTTPALAIFLLLAGTARAIVVSGTFTGIIAGNTLDTYGLFGTAGAALSGETISASYSYDTALFSFYSAQSTSDSFLGTGGLTLRVTAGARTVATVGVTNSEIIDTQDGALTEVTLENFAPTPLVDFTLFAQGAWTSGRTINAPFMLDPTFFGQTIYVSADGRHDDMLDFAGSSAAATPASEPATLALFCVGVAGIGRVRRSNLTFLTRQAWRSRAPTRGSGCGLPRKAGHPELESGRLGGAPIRPARR